MGVEIRLTDRELPISPVMIEYLDRAIHGSTSGAEWMDQVSEQLIPMEPERRLRYAEVAAQGVLDHPDGQRAIFRAYELLAGLAIGNVSVLEPIRENFRFICIVGCPRHGGTYLTKELFRALGIEPRSVPNVIAHDGFPDLVPFRLQEKYNVHTAMTQQLSEYLAMAEHFFRDAPRRDGRIVVPKKATKAAYAGAFLHSVLGPDTEYWITLRHPVPACISTYEKSGGLPGDGRFAKRSNIEEWVVRDAVWLGAVEDEILRRDYFDAYLSYWERYHLNLALTGLPAARNVRFVAYGGKRLPDVARAFHARFGSSNAVEAFHNSDSAGRHREWAAKAESALRRVADVWSTVGWTFPIDAVMEMA